jgi:hypothetical protein
MCGCVLVFCVAVWRGCVAVWWCDTLLYGGVMCGCTDGAGVVGGAPSTLERRQQLASRQDAPLQHIEARHKQAEEQARNIVEEVLLTAGGLDAYKYVEGP